MRNTAEHNDIHVKFAPDHEHDDDEAHIHRGEHVDHGQPEWAWWDDYFGHGPACVHKH